MEQSSNMKSLFIIVNAGYSSDIVEIAREAGARGATILNARGSSAKSSQTIMGITVDSEKEIILCLSEEATAKRIMAAVKEKAGYGTPAHSVCFVMPVEKMIGASNGNVDPIAE